MATALDKYADLKPNWDYPVVIESHINGERTKEMNPNTPRSYDEIADEAMRMWEAGAGAIHAHNSGGQGLVGEDSYKDYMRSWDRVLQKYPDITWYPSNLNSLRLLPEEHGLDHVPYLMSGANVHVSCVLPGISMFATHREQEGYLAGREFGYNFQRVAGQVKMCREADAPIAWMIHETGHVRHALHYVNSGMVTKGSTWDFFLIGEYGLTSLDPIATTGIEPTLESLYYYLTMIEKAQVKLPWFVSIWGQGAADTTDVMRRVIELGGHIKTGLELFYDPARNPTNLELLQQAQEIAREVGRPIATQEEARRLYNIA